MLIKRYQQVVDGRGKMQGHLFSEQFEEKERLEKLGPNSDLEKRKMDDIKI